MISPIAIVWLVGFCALSVGVLWINARSEPNDQLPAPVVFILAIWPIWLGMMLVALLICTVGMLAELLTDPRNPQ